MRFFILTLGLTTILLGYALYLLLIKKDSKAFKKVMLPGLFFISVWGAIYYFILN